MGKPKIAAIDLVYGSLDLDFRFSPFEILTGSGALIVCLFFVCVFSEASAIEEEVATSVTAALNSDELYWSGVEANGQAIVLTGAAPDTAAGDIAAERVARVFGVASVSNQIKVIGADGYCHKALDNYASKDGIRFKSGKAEVVASSFETISVLAMIIRACKGPIEVAVHMDNAGDSEINRRLSQRRADRLAKYLVNYGVPTEQVRAVGYGESQPIVRNETDEGRRVNRRIEFRVLGGTA